MEAETRIFLIKGWCLITITGVLALLGSYSTELKPAEATIMSLVGQVLLLTSLGAAIVFPLRAWLDRQREKKKE